MTRVANFAQFQLSQANIQRTQTAVALNQIQLATGQKAQAYSEIPTSTTELISLERSLERSNQFVDNIDQALTRLNTYDSTFGVLVDRAIDLKSIISQGLTGNNIDDLPLTEFARSYSTEVESLLNSQLGGRYIFSGSKTDAPAVDINDPSYTPQVGLPGAFTADFDYYQGDDFEVALRPNENFELAYGVTAGEPAFEDLLRAFAYLDYAGQNRDKTVLAEALNLVDSAIDGLSDLRGQVGAQTQILENSRNAHADFNVFASNIVSNIEEVDIAQATTELAFNQVQLQGAFLSLSRINELSLLQFI